MGIVNLDYCPTDYQILSVENQLFPIADLTKRYCLFLINCHQIRQLNHLHCWQLFHVYRHFQRKGNQLNRDDSLQLHY